MCRSSNLCVALALLCGLPLSYGQAQSDSQQPPQPDPYENTSVLVEAFVVRVSNAALAEGGVNPIGQAPDAVSPLKILWCLKDEEKARVISGAKAACRHKGESIAENRDTWYVGREKTSTTMTPQGPQTTTDVRFEEYSSGLTFTINPTVKSDNTVGFFFSYSESGVTRQEDKTSPPNRFSYKWESRVTVQSGVPVIAGAAQGPDTTTFLVLTATIQTATEIKD